MGTLNQLYEVYCGTVSDLQATRAGARREQLQERADELWLQYVEQGGGREPWHTPGQPWAYQDGFEELHPRVPKYEGLDYGPQQLVFLARQLRVLLNLPKGYAYKVKPGEQDQFYEYTYYMDREVWAVKTFQRNHHLPETGVVDRRTWQVLAAERGERKPAQLRNVFELPGSSDRPVPLVLRERRHWRLALDDIEERTYANHHNLALMAVLAYADIAVGKHVEGEMQDKWNEPRLREDVLVLDDEEEKGGKRWPVFVRESRKEQLYDYRSLSNDRTHTQGFVLGHPSHIVVALRGTEMSELSVDGFKAAVADMTSNLAAQAQRWMYDGSLDEKERGAGTLDLQVHKGFYDAFDSIREQLAEHVREFRRDNPRKPIFVTGHSLGGAIACLTACYLRSHREFSSHPVQLYTYAQPRVGTLKFAAHYWTNHGAWARAPGFRYFRTAHLFDPITMIPSAYLADNVADVADVLIDFSTAAAAVAAGGELVHWELRQALAKRGKAWQRAQLEQQCSSESDYRHFGVPVLCLHGADGHPFVVQEPISQRQVEDPSIPRLQTVHEAKNAAKSQRIERLWEHFRDIDKHMMGSYLSHTLHAFEHSAMDYLSDVDVFPPMSGEPRVSMYDRQLFHRFVHQYQHVEAHAQEQQRAELRIVDPDGNPVSGAQVIVHCDGRSQEFTTDGEGLADIESFTANAPYRAELKSFAGLACEGGVDMEEDGTEETSDYDPGEPVVGGWCCEEHEESP